MKVDFDQWISVGVSKECAHSTQADFAVQLR